MSERIVNIENAPVIFPKYTAQLMLKGVDLQITGHREADSRLAAEVYDAILFNNVEDLPDIMVYDINSKTWSKIFADPLQRIALKNKTNIVVEYVNIVQEWTEAILIAIKNFVAQFSAARVVV